MAHCQDPPNAGASVSDILLMTNILGLCTEFDAGRGVLFLTAMEPLRLGSKADLESFGEAVDCLLKEHFSKKRGFLLVDLQQIVIEPKHLDTYAAGIREFYRLYLRPKGLIAYGFEITRITAQLSHEMYERHEPNIFNTRREAELFIDELIDDTAASNGEAASVHGTTVSAETYSSSKT